METIRLEESPYLIKEPLDLAQLVTHNDPFNPNDKTFIVIPSGVSCYSTLVDFKFDPEFYDIVISRNQEIVEEDFIIEAEDIISFSLVPKGGGGGKQILSIIAMVALAVVTAGAGAVVGGLGGGFMGGAAAGFGATMSAAMAAGAWGTVAFMGGMMIAGSMLISSLFKPNIPSAPSLESFEQSTTYGWNVQGNSLAQGGAVPILYGTHRVTPQYIGKYLHTVNDVQTLKALLAVAEGPLDSIDFIQINDQDIINYTDVYTETRLGTNDQIIIQDFNDTWSDQGVNKKLTDTDTWQYATTSGDAVTSITVGINCPQGLFYANDQGGLSTYTVYIDIEYKAWDSNTWLSYVDNSTTWDTQYWYVDQHPVASNSRWRTTYSADSIGPFDVYKKPIAWKGGPDGLLEHVGTVTNKPASATGKAIFPPGASFASDGAQQAWTETKKENTVTYFQISGAQSSAIRRSYTATNLTPNKYDVRVRFYQNPETSSRYGSTVYFESLQEAISDDFTYPNTALLGLSIKATDQLSGGMPKVTVLAKRTTGTYGSLDNPAWACLDLLTNSRYGAGLDISSIDLQSFTDWATFCDTNNYKVNIYLDQFIDLSQAIRLIGQLGRGTIIQYGSEFRALMDKADISATQGFLFSMGNIIKDSFSESFLPLKDRANAVEVTYYDAENDYERTTIEVTQGNYDLTSQINKTSIDLIGCTSKEQALKQAKYHLNQNRYITITATFEVSFDAIHCQVGDIINVAHDVPQWGYSGRIISNTDDTITVDRDDLEMVAGSQMYIQVSDASTDVQEYRQVISVSGNILTITGVPLPTLGEYSVYSFGVANRHAKKMRVLSITTAGDFKRKVTAVEYNDNVYNDTVTIPTPTLVNDLSTRSLTVSEYLQLRSGVFVPVVDLMWSGARLNYNVQYKKATETKYVSAGIAVGNTFSIEGLTEGVTYDFLVDGVKAQYTVQGQSVPPVNVTNLHGIEVGGTFEISWENPDKPIDFKEYIVFVAGVEVGRTTSTRYTTGLIAVQGSVLVEVQVVDYAGNHSGKESVLVVVDPVLPVEALTGEISNGLVTLNWAYPVYPIDFARFDIYDTGVYIGNSTKPEYIATAKNHTIGNVTYTVIAVDQAGNESVAVSTALQVVAPTMSNFTYSFENNMCTLDWDDTQGSYQVPTYTVNTGGKTWKVGASQANILVNWLGSRTVTITAKDTAGNSTQTTTNIMVVAPSTPIVSSTFTTAGIDFSWETVEGSCGIKEYIVTYGGDVITTYEPKLSIPYRGVGSYSVSVIARDYAGNTSSAGTNTKTITTASVYNLLVQSSGYDLKVTWDSTQGSVGIANYRIEYGAVSEYVTEKEYTIIPTGLTPLTITVTPYDISGVAGVSSQFVFTPQAPGMPTVSSTIVGATVIFNLADLKTTYNTDMYELSYDGNTINIPKGLARHTLPISWDNSKDFTFKAVDILGNKSIGYVETVYVAECSVDSLTADVVDNNVLLKWTYTEGTLPIERFSIRKGIDKDTATEIGVRKGTFTAVFENESGNYTYWVVPFDTAGNEGIAKSLITSVSQPPDFILNVEWTSDWSGTKSNVLVLDSTSANLPVNTTETYATHFTSRSWTTVQNQIDAGYPLWLSPTIGTATYSQVFDYGTVLGSTSITLSDPSVIKTGSGTYSFTKQISVSLDNSTWSDMPVDQAQVFVTNIRYVKVTYVYTTSTNTILTVGNFTLRLDAKIRNDSGSGYANATDVGGTTVNFNYAFVDVTSITVTPSGTTPLIAVYDFVDVANPTSFKVLLYTTAGVRANGNFSWTARGY